MAVREVSLHHVNDMAGGQRGETITEQISCSATKLRVSVPVRNCTSCLAAFNAGLRGNNSWCVAQASAGVRVTLTFTRVCALSMPVGPGPLDMIKSPRPSSTSKLLNDALRSRSPSSWTSVRGARRCVGAGSRRRRLALTSAK